MTCAVEISNLYKKYDNGEEALKGISLSVESGDFFALLGANGAGKSTTIGILFSLVRKMEGQVKIYGVDIDDNFLLARSYMGLVPQEFNFNQFKPAFEVLTTQAGYYGIPARKARIKAEHYLKKLELWDKRDSEVRELSGGMKRRLMVARALINEPRLLVLDEPTAGVDIEVRHMIWNFMTELNQNGTTIILTTHYLEEAERLCRNVAIIAHGRIVECAPMNTLLTREVGFEEFILYLDHSIDTPPTIDSVETRLLNNTTLEVRVNKGQSMNCIFQALDQNNVRVMSMRNKVNRLEQTLLDRMDKNVGKK